MNVNRAYFTTKFSKFSLESLVGIDMMAKIFPVIGIFLTISLLVLLFLQRKANIEVQQIEQTLQISSSEPKLFTQEMIRDLSEPVQRYFRHAIAPGTPLANSVHLTMHGNIRLAPEQAWTPLQADETLSPRGFVWKATAVQGLMQMRGADYYTQGKGRMRFSLWGLIPAINAHNPDVIRSGMGRWAGESFWLPSALLPERGVSWQVIDHNTIQAHLKVDGEPIALTFVIDDQGRLMRSFLPRWGNQTADKRYAEIPFGGNYQAEETFGGYTIPSQMGAGWWFGTNHYFEFFRVSIKQAVYQ
jgi:hypothetical protein